MNKKYSLASSSWDEKEISAINKVIETGNYSMGKFVREFEEKFSEYIGSKFCVMVNSGSSANLLSVGSLFYTQTKALKPGDEVIVPAVSWSTSYTPLQQYGLKLKFVDIDIDTLNYNLDDLSDAVTNKTKLILIVNILGNPNDFSRIKKIINGRDIILVEDNCESLGAKFNNKMTGTFGKLGTFSFFYSHHMSTMEGGMICTDNRELYDILLALRAHGWTRNLDESNLICKKSNNLFNESFRFILPGYNMRPLEFSGSIGIVQLSKLNGFLKQRKRNYLKFKEVFNRDERFLIQKEIGESSWFGFSLILNDNNLKREDILKKFEEYKIEYRPIVSGNFVKSESLKYYNYEVFGTMKNAEYLDRNGLFIGNHHYDLSDEFEMLKKAIKSL